MFQLPIAAAENPEADRILNGIIDGFTSVPETVWNHLKQADSAPLYNLSWIAGLLLLLALLVWTPVERLLLVILLVLVVFIIASA